MVSCLGSFETLVQMSAPLMVYQDASCLNSLHIIKGGKALRIRSEALFVFVLQKGHAPSALGDFMNRTFQLSRTFRKERHQASDRYLEEKHSSSLPSLPWRLEISSFLIIVWAGGVGSDKWNSK